MSKEYDKEFYYSFHKFVHGYMNRFYHLNITGTENIPKDPNYILAGNHLNILDSWLLLASNPDYMRFCCSLNRWFISLVSFIKN